MAETRHLPICKNCGEQIEETGGSLYPWTHADPEQQKCYRAEPATDGIARCKHLGCNLPETDLIHHEVEVQRREIAVGMDDQISKTCHEFVRDEEATRG